MVRIRGLEPPLPCENMDLNHARLPIPPYPHVWMRISILQDRMASVKSRPVAKFEDQPHHQRLNLGGHRLVHSLFAPDRVVYRPFDYGRSGNAHRHSAHVYDDIEALLLRDLHPFRKLTVDPEIALLEHLAGQRLDDGRRTDARASRDQNIGT